MSFDVCGRGPHRAEPIYLEIQEENEYFHETYIWFIQYMDNIPYNMLLDLKKLLESTHKFRLISLKTSESDLHFLIRRNSIEKNRHHDRYQRIDSFILNQKSLQKFLLKYKKADEDINEITWKFGKINFD